MGTNSADLQPDQSNSTPMSLPATVSLRCVECATLYPAVENQPRYRCDCGGVLDVEMIPRPALREAFEALAAPESEFTPLSGAHWRQLFDRRASLPLTWLAGTGTAALDASGVWRYRELILPVPEPYIVSRPEGNTGLYPAGIENCGDDRPGHRQIGYYAGLDQLFLKHEELIQASIVSNLPVSRAVISAVFYAGRIQPRVAFRTADDVWFGNRQDEFTIAPDATGVKRGCAGTCQPGQGKRGAPVKKLSPVSTR